MEKRKQAASKKVMCNTCGAYVHARGLFGHMRLAHSVILKTITQTKTIVNGTKIPVDRTVAVNDSLSRNNLPLYEERANDIISVNPKISDNSYDFNKNRKKEERIPYVAGHKEWIKHWIKDLRKAKKEWLDFKKLEKSTNGLIWGVNSIQVKIQTLWFIMEPGNENNPSHRVKDYYLTKEDQNRIAETLRHLDE